MVASIRLSQDRLRNVRIAQFSDERQGVATYEVDRSVHFVVLLHLIMCRKGWQTYGS